MLPFPPYVQSRQKLNNLRFLESVQWYSKSELQSTFPISNLTAVSITNKISKVIEQDEQCTLRP